MSKNGWKSLPFEQIAELIKDGYQPTGVDNNLFVSKYQLELPKKEEI